MTRRKTHATHVSASYYKCPFCTEVIPYVGIKKPSHFSPTIGTFKCSKCEAELLLKIKKEKGVDNTLRTFVIGTKPTEKSLEYQKALEPKKSKNANPYDKMG